MVCLNHKSLYAGVWQQKKEISVIATDIHVGCNSLTVSPCSTGTIFPYV
jgi:hypothetical protein